MFCPKCGNELPEGAEFCPGCGQRMGKGNTTTPTFRTVTGDSKAGVGKFILIAVIVLAVVLIAVLVVIKLSRKSDSNESQTVSTDVNDDIKTTVTEKQDGGFSSYEELIDALFSAAYSKDEKAVVGCYPKEMESYAIQLYNDFRNGTYNSETLLFNFMNLNPDNEYSYEISGTTALDQSEIDSLKSEFGIAIDEGYVVEVASSGKYHQVIPEMNMDGYVTDGCSGYLEVARIGKSWYLVKGDDLWVSTWFD